MKYNAIAQNDIQFFQEKIGKENVFFDEENVQKYAQDKTENLFFAPEIVLKPTTTQQVSIIVYHCNENQIPITPRGAGTGLAGGALPVLAGVVLSLEKMNQILDIDIANFQATVEAGVINFDLQKALEIHGLFYPPDPSSWGSSFIGGNIATNAGGPKAVKYGVTAQYVLNLEVVLPNGEIIWTGANTLKNSTGYNLTQLFVGSEGTLGVVTKAVVKVLPKPAADISLLIPFFKMEEACEAVTTIIKAGLTPSVLEFMERKALEKANQFIEDVNIPLVENIQAHLIVMFDGNNLERLMEEAEKTAEILSQFNIGEIFLADTEIEKDRIWKVRRKIAEVVKANGYTIEEDTVVPRSKMGELVNFVHQLTEKNGCEAVCYGHAGDGNLHVRINHPKYKNSYQVPEIQTMLKILFIFIKNLGGTISGEHGIGLTQKEYMPLVFENAALLLQKEIKKAIDPNLIMNPMKIV